MSWFLLHSWKIILPDIEFLVDSLLAHWMSSQSLLASMVVDDKSVVGFTYGSLYDEWLLSCQSEDSVFGVWQVEYNVSWCGSLWVHSLYSLWTSQICLKLSSSLERIGLLLLEVYFQFLSQLSCDSTKCCYMCICWYTWCNLTVF